MIGAHKALKPILINEYNEQFELIVVEVKVANTDIRIISGYGPQETWIDDERLPFFQALEEEIVKAELAGKSLIIEADFNSKLGPEFIPNDPHQQSEKNGKLLANIIRRQKLTVANGHVKCEGVITRKRVTTERTEESAISFVLLSEDLVDKIESVKIDEKREHVLTRITETKDGNVIKESDHNVIETNLNLPWNKEHKEEKNNLFNLKNEECQKLFKVETTNTNSLSKPFEDEEDLDVATNKFFRRLDKFLHKCFRKIGTKKEKINEKHEQMYNLWKTLRNKTDVKSVAERLEAEEILADKYFKKIEDATKDIECDEGGFSSQKLWALKKQMYPQQREPPTAMVDKQGNLETNESKLKKMAVEAFKERLANRPMKDELEDIKVAKEKLAEKLMEKARNNKTPPWKMRDLEKVLRQLKKDKSRDPHGLANELFKTEVAGKDLKKHC